MEIPVATTNRGIAEEGVAGIDADGFARGKRNGESPEKGGSAIVRAGAVGEVPLEDTDIVSDALDRSALG